MMLRYSLVVILLTPCAIAVPEFTATTANAACGDWTVLRDGPNASVTHRGVSGIASASIRPTFSGFATMGHESAPVPCHGPFCRSAPNQPAPMMPVTLPRMDLVLLGVLPGAVDGSMAETCWTASQDGAHPAKGFPKDIEHPPRV